jgi:pentatricopeptide repeat protein
VDTEADDGDVTYVQVVDGVRRLAEQGKVAEALKALELIPACGITPDCKVYTVAMAALSHKTVRNYPAAERVFDMMVKSGAVPNEKAWGALVHAQAKGKGANVALAQIDRLKALGVQPTVHMFTSVLNAMIDTKRYDDAEELWLRMHGEGIELTKEAFTTMLKHCAKTGQVAVVGHQH